MRPSLGWWYDTPPMPRALSGSLGTVCVRGLCPLPPTLGFSRLDPLPAAQDWAYREPSSPPYTCPWCSLSLICRPTWDPHQAAVVCALCWGFRMEGNRQAEKESIKLYVRYYFSWSLWLTWGLSGPPSLMQVKSVDFTDDVWGQGKESFHATKPWSPGCSLSPCLGVRAQACRPKTHFQDTCLDTLSSLAYITLTRSYGKMDFSGVQSCMFLNTFVIQRKKPPKIS